MPVGLQDASLDANEPLNLNCPIIVGNPDFPNSANTVAMMISSNAVPNYFQLNIHNNNTSVNTSADIVATADNGSDSTHYVDFGINGSIGGSAPFTNANAGYLYTTDNEFDVCAQGATANINFYTAGSAAANLAGYFDQNQLFYNGGNKFVSTNFAVTSNAVLATVTGLSVTLLAGKAYSFSGSLYTTSTSGGGVAFGFGGTATATTFIGESSIQQGGAITQTRVTALGACGSLSTATTARIDFFGSIVVNAAGTFTIQFAQQTSNAAASTVLVGSDFIINKLN